jgi:hypothetical protein
MSRIETDKTIPPHLPVSTEERAGNLIEACVARGIAHLRTHVDIDLESRLLKPDGVLAARAGARADVALPQSGGMRLASPPYACSTCTVDDLTSL